MFHLGRYGELLYVVGLGLCHFMRFAWCLFHQFPLNKEYHVIKYLLMTSYFQVPGTVKLAVHINGTYRARWNDALGFCMRLLYLIFLKEQYHLVLPVLIAKHVFSWGYPWTFMSIATKSALHILLISYQNIVLFDLRQACWTPTGIQVHKNFWW